MTAIGFYHLTRTSADQVLPPLLGRTLDAGARAVIRCATQDHLDALDRSLWLCATPEWLPHGSAHPPLQPIYLTLHDERPNDASFLFLLDGTETAQPTSYQRVFDLFDGTDEAAVAAARQRWTRHKSAGHTLTYWQQGPIGWTSA